MADQFKEMKNPFGLYDVFGYILPGWYFYTLFIIDFDGSKVMRYFMSNNTLIGIEKANYIYKLDYFVQFMVFNSKYGFGIIPLFIFLIFCYLTGHVIASFSSFLAKHLVKRFLKHPSDNLFPEYNQKEDRGRLYNFASLIYNFVKNFCGNIANLNYKRPFDEAFRNTFTDTIDVAYGYSVQRSDYYWMTYTYICANYPNQVYRLQHFVNLAGFARNVAGAFVLYLLLRLIVFSWYLKCNIDKPVVIILIGLLFVNMIMFWTYLRLHKRQAVDMYYLFIALHKGNQVKE
jgi:hypothetical protein